MKNKQQIDKKPVKIDKDKLAAYLARFSRKGKPARVPLAVSDAKSAKEICADLRKWLRRND
jgi:hypothetical protein